MANKTDSIDTARLWTTPALRNFFRAEIANGKNGGVEPATLSSAIDSLSQHPFGFGLDLADCSALLIMIDYCGGDTELREFL